MKTVLGSFAAVVLLSLGTQAFAAELTPAQIGEKIYKQAFGRGCGACHDIASNPQLPALIKAGKLDKKTFAEVIENGRNGMPKATAAIMGVGAVDKAGLNKDQAIDAIYEFLSK